MYTRKPLPRGFPSFFLFYEVMEEKKMAKTCNNCGTENQVMSTITMSSADWQRNEQRHEKREKRLWIALIVAISMLFASFALFVWYESQFETITYEQDGEGINNVNYGEQGDLNNGAESENQAEEEK